MRTDQKRRSVFADNPQGRRMFVEGLLMHIEQTQEDTKQNIAKIRELLAKGVEKQ